LTGELGDFTPAGGDVVACRRGVLELTALVGCRGRSEVLRGCTVVDFTLSACFTAVNKHIPSLNTMNGNNPVNQYAHYLLS